MRSLVLLNSKSAGIQHGLTYDTTDFPVVAGSLVRVPIRKSIVEGIVLKVLEKQTKEEFEPRPIKEVVSNAPLLPPTHLQLLEWMSSYYCCTPRAAIRPFLPSSPWTSATEKPVIKVSLISTPEKAGAKQEALLRILKEHNGPMERSTLLKKSGASASTLTSLQEKGYVTIEEHAIDGTVHTGPYTVRAERPTLTDAQQTAYSAIKNSTKPSLLFGVTGSGKTEIYASLIADQAAEGKQSILLLPEILLTQHIIHRFETLFDRERIAVIHSRLTPAAKRKEWMRARSGDAALIIGSRSALFAPCPNLGLVIMDEEHEWTYKNEQTPRYHARETAENLCALTGATLLLGSATPSVESWHRAKNDQYTLVSLPERYQGRALPTVQVVDLATVNFGSLYPFSPTLLDAIRKRLDAGEQTVLFLNRRGSATSVLCMQCRQRLMSPISNLPFTVHKTYAGKPYLVDHIGGITADLPSTCPHCGSVDIRSVGAGTQRLEELLTSVFPQARILRADSDTMSHPDDMKDILATMRERNGDILLGTQSVVKGLDLPGVTLAAVLIADVGMSLPHFRAGERTFQLLTQLTGRSGRAVPGEVIIQTFRPQAVEVVAASEHRTEDYLTTELSLRQTLHYPPASELIRFVVRDERPEVRAKILQKELASVCEKHSIQATATAAPTFFGMGKEWHVLLRGKDTRKTLDHIDLHNIVVDIDPMDVL